MVSWNYISRHLSNASVWATTFFQKWERLGHLQKLRRKKACELGKWCYSFLWLFFTYHSFNYASGSTPGLELSPESPTLQSVVDIPVPFPRSYNIFLLPSSQEYSPLKLHLLSNSFKRWTICESTCFGVGLLLCCKTMYIRLCSNTVICHWNLNSLLVNTVMGKLEIINQIWIAQQSGSRSEREDTWAG